RGRQLGLGGDAEERVEPLVEGHAVDDEQEAVIHAAEVEEAVVLGGPARGGRDRRAQGAAGDPLRDALQGLARKRGPGREHGGLRIGGDEQRLARPRREGEADLLGERAPHDDAQERGLERRALRAGLVGAGSDPCDRERARGIDRGGSQDRAPFVEQHDAGPGGGLARGIHHEAADLRARRRGAGAARRREAGEGGDEAEETYIAPPKPAPLAFDEPPAPAHRSSLQPIGPGNAQLATAAATSFLKWKVSSEGSTSTWSPSLNCPAST